jgi:hypothetical protein
MGVNQTFQIRLLMSANDPEQTIQDRFALGY